MSNCYQIKSYIVLYTLNKFNLETYFRWKAAFVLCRVINFQYRFFMVNVSLPDDEKVGKKKQLCAGWQ